MDKKHGFKISMRPHTHKTDVPTQVRPHTYRCSHTHTKQGFDTYSCAHNDDQWRPTDALRPWLRPRLRPTDALMTNRCGSDQRRPWLQPTHVLRPTLQQLLHTPTTTQICEKHSTVDVSVIYKHSFGRNIVRPNTFSAELSFGRNIVRPKSYCRKKISGRPNLYTQIEGAIIAPFDLMFTFSAEK
jgi:hypothetical protein